MGEFATYENESIKIGTCESMYYLRYEQRNDVKPQSGSVNPATCLGLHFRLPFPDEDNIEPGSFENPFRGERLWSKEDNYASDLAEKLPLGDGIMQLHNEAGLLVNINCYHGTKLPQNTNETRFFWNGKSWFLELSAIKTTENGIRPIIKCRFCSTSWNTDWTDIEAYIHGELKLRLQKYF